ncbi:MAG TPA: arylsulfotransferase family protein [Gemmataceae bacterium]|nr:arylsulfotransferase family protein [Gemmataceae bacterium]
MKPEDGPALPKPALRRPLLGAHVSRGLSALGVAVLGYVLGAAVMVFGLPSSDLLGKALIGGRAWLERIRLPSPAADPNPARMARDGIDEPGKTFDGFTLYACASVEAPGARVYLVNMRRQVVHQWAVDFKEIWPVPPRLQGSGRDDLVCAFAAYLYPNGDLLVVLHSLESIVKGYGLVKLDKDSHVLWKYAAPTHHSVDVGEDGTIYAIQQQLVETVPTTPGQAPTPRLVDDLIVLSPKGELKKTVPILDALRGSRYAALLGSLERGGAHRAVPGGLTAAAFDEALLQQDVLHANSVRVLSHERAPRFPAFEPGQVLLSLRNLHALVVLDVGSGSVVWAARGPWEYQHDAEFLDNGHLLLFDNLGLSRGSRVLEYDPRTQAFPWSYSGEDGHPFYSSKRGMSQRLPNGNTLVVSSEGGEVLEVTRDKHVVWSLLSPPDSHSATERRFITLARRYGPDQLHFLKEGERARP